MALQWWLILNRRAATLVTLLSTQGCLSASSRVRKVSNVHTPAIQHIYEDLQSYIRTPAIVHTPAMLVYSTKRSWVRPPSPWGWISPALASHIFHHVPILMRPNNNNKHFNAPSLRKSHVWREWDGIKSWSVVPGWGQLHIRALPRWSQRLRNNNKSEHSCERKFAGCDGRSPLPREMWRFPWCVVTEDIFSFLANFRLCKYEGNNRDC